MKILKTLSVILSLSLLLGTAQAVEVGKPAPQFSLSDGSGKAHQLSDYRGKYVVLEWFNKDCPFVRKHYGSGNMQKLQKLYTQKGVVWLSIVSSAKDKQGYLTNSQAQSLPGQNHSSPTALLLDPSGNVGHLFNAKTTPHMFIINPQGVLEYQGAIDDTPSTDQEDIPSAKNYVSAALNELLSGKKVSTSETKPYGCSIKY